jgi:hypothetical protein
MLSIARTTSTFSGRCSFGTHAAFQTAVKELRAKGQGAKLFDSVDDALAKGGIKVGLFNI